MSTSSSVIYVDTSTRALAVYAGNVTSVDYGCGHRGFVIRVAAQIGNLSDFPEKFRFEIPVVISERGYRAQSSAGFVSIDRGFNFVDYQLLIGKMQLERKLQVLGHPEGIVFLAPGTCIQSVPCHGNSNPATAEAARSAMKIRAQARRNIVVSEGQSDYVKGWEFIQPDPDDAEELWQIDFPSEHRSEKFSPERLVRSCYNFNKKFLPVMERERELAWLVGILGNGDLRSHDAYASWQKLLAKTEETPSSGEEISSDSDSSADEEEFVELE